MAAGAWNYAESGDSVSGDSQSRLDTKKRTIYASEQDAVARAEWRDQAATLDASLLVFIDETSTTRNMTRRYARAPANERAVGYVPRNYGQRTTLVAAITPAEIAAPMLLEGAIDSAAFEAYVEQCLCPILRQGQIVVMDNLSSHHKQKVRTLIEAVGCTVLYLPTYSPDFNPIEHMFSKVKEWLRSVAARTQEELDQAIVQAFAQIMPQDIRGWFSHCGYELS